MKCNLIKQQFITISALMCLYVGYFKYKNLLLVSTGPHVLNLVYPFPSYSDLLNWWKKSYGVIIQMKPLQ